MKILITGAFGFVGTNLSAYLAAKGHELWALDLLRPPSGRNWEGKNEGGTGVGTLNAQRSTLNAQVGMGKEKKAQHTRGGGDYARCFTWEELEKIPWEEVDAVVHLAGKAHDTRNAGDPQSYFDVNVGLTKKVLEAWKDGNVTTEKENVGFSRKDAKAQRKFIFFSSVKAVADRVEGVLTEDAIPDPKTPYGQSKLEAEKEVLKCGGRSSKVLKCESSKVGESVTANEANGADHGNSRILELVNFRPYILRPCMIHGPGNRGNLNLLYGVVRRGIPWPLGAFENRRSFASIGNVCAVVEGLLTADVEPGVYQVADDEALSTNDLITLMAETMRRKVRIWRVSERFIRRMANIGDVLRLPLDSERLKKLAENYVVSNAKIKAALGWERMPVSARDGMRRTTMSFETTKGTKNTGE